MKKNPLEQAFRKSQAVKKYADGALVTAQTGQTDPITNVGTGSSGLGELIWEPIRDIFQTGYTAPEVNTGITEQPVTPTVVPQRPYDPREFASYEDAENYSPIGYVNPSGRQFYEYEPITYTGPAPTDLTRFQTTFDPKTGRMFYSPAEALAYGVTDYVLSTPTGLPKPPSLANTSDEEIAKKASRFGISPDAYMNYYRQIDAAKPEQEYFNTRLSTQNDNMPIEDLVAKLQYYDANPPKDFQELQEQRVLWADYNQRYASSQGTYENLGGVGQNWELQPERNFFAPTVTGYANSLDQVLNEYAKSDRTQQEYYNARDFITENPSIDRILTNAEAMLGRKPFEGTDANFNNARMRMLQGQSERIGEPYAESNMYRQLADEYAASLPFGSAANADPKYRALREAQWAVRPVVNDTRWETVANRSQGNNPERILWRDPETGRGFGYEKDQGGYLLVYGPDGSPLSGALTKDSGDVIKLLDDYSMTPEKLKSFNDAMKQSAGVDMAQTGLNVEALADKSKIAEIASDKYVQDVMANYDRQQEIARNAGFATPSDLSRTTYMQNILSQQAAAKAMLGNTTPPAAKNGGAVMMKRGGPVNLEKEFRLADMIDMKGMGSAKKFDEGGKADKSESKMELEDYIKQDDLRTLLQEIARRIQLSGEASGSKDGTQAFGRLGYRQPIGDDMSVDVGASGHYVKGKGYQDSGIDRADMSLSKRFENDSELRARLGANLNQYMGKRGLDELMLEYEMPFKNGGDVKGYALAGLVKKAAQAGSKMAKKDKGPALPLDLVRAKPKTKQEITDIADRVARQQSGEFVRKSELSGNPKHTQNLAGRSGKEVKRLEDLDYTLERTKDIRPTPTYESEIGDINVAIPGDQTIADFRLVDVDGRPIDSIQQGGSLYGEGKLDLEDPLFWASEEGIAQILQDKITKLAQLYNTDKVTAYHLAMGQDANNFAMHFADANLKAIANSDLSPEAIEIFNQAVREGPPHPKTGKKIPMPHFAGIENPEEAYLQMLENPMLRKWFNNRMKIDEVTTKIGLPSGKDIQWAITEPALRNMEINLTGHSVGRMKPFAELTDTADHATYAKGIQGESLGKAPEVAPFELAFPDADLYLRSVYAPSDLTGTMQKVFPHQKVDQQQLDQMSEYYRRLREIRGYKEGGSAELEKEFKGKSRLIPKAVIDALNTKRKLSPAEAKIAGEYAKPENQWNLGSILEEFDPAYLMGRGAETLKNVDYGAIKDLLLQRYQLEKNPRAALEKELGQIGQVISGAVDIAEPLGAVATKPARKAIKSLAQKFEGVPVGMSIKPVGGQWFPRGVQNELEDLKMIDTENPTNKAVNAWVDGTLRKYLMNRMGTENDEVRKLFDEGIHHIDPSNLNLSNYVDDLEENRKFNYYGKQLAKTNRGKKWEDASDSAIFPRVAGNLGSHIKKTYPWINKLPPKEKIYALSSNMENNPDVMRNLGFDHVVDVLKNDIREGRLRPEQLNKVSVEDAIKRTHNYNIEMAKKAEEAGIMTHQGLPIHREYPEGYKWVELKYSEPTDAMPEGFKITEGVDPVTKRSGFYAETPNTRSPLHLNRHEAERQLQNYLHNINKEKIREKTKNVLTYEGDTMGHCVGSYCEDVLEGNTRIFSLRDAEGKPHVTVEVTAQDAPSFYQANEHLFESNPELKDFVEYANDMSGSESEFIDDVTRKMKQLGIEPVAAEGDYYIKQIKGKGNAKPADKYIPYVQDFVKNPIVEKNWAGVSDLQNTGLMNARRVKDEGLLLGEPKEVEQMIMDELERIYPKEVSELGVPVWAGQHGEVIQPFDMLKYEVQDLTSPYITSQDIIEHLKTKPVRPVEQTYSKYYENLPKEEGMASGGSINNGLKRLVSRFDSEYPVPFPRDN